MRYRRKPIPQPDVQAVQLVHAVEMPGVASEQPIIGHAGDWLVIDDQRQFFMSDPEFRAQYEEVKPPPGLNQQMASAL